MAGRAPWLQEESRAMNGAALVGAKKRWSRPALSGRGGAHAPWRAGFGAPAETNFLPEI